MSTVTIVQYVPERNGYIVAECPYMGLRGSSGHAQSLRSSRSEKYRRSGLFRKIMSVAVPK